MKKLWFLLSCVFLLIIDAMLKYYTVHHIGKMGVLTPFFPYGGIPVFYDFFGISFSLNYVANKGSAFGLFSAYSAFLFYIRVLIVMALAVYLVFYGRKKNVFFPLTLILTGAVGNIIDTILYGHVVDMFHFNFFGYSYPVFNVADSLICIAIFWMFLLNIAKKPKVESDNRDNSGR
jgi:signal peptidase II